MLRTAYFSLFSLTTCTLLFLAAITPHPGCWNIEKKLSTVQLPSENEPIGTCLKAFKSRSKAHPNSQNMAHECSAVGPGPIHVHPLNSASGCSEGKVWNSSPKVAGYSSSPLCWGHLFPQQAHLSAFCWTRTTQMLSGLCFMPAPETAKCGSVVKWEIKEPPPLPSAELLQRIEATVSTSVPPRGLCWPPHTHPFTMASQTLRETLTTSPVLSLL